MVIAASTSRPGSLDPSPPNPTLPNQGGAEVAPTSATETAGASGTASHSNPEPPITVGIEPALPPALHMTMAADDGPSGPNDAAGHRTTRGRRRGGPSAIADRSRPTATGTAATGGTRHPTHGRGFCSVRRSLAAQMLTGASLGQDRNKRADGSASELLPASVHDVPHGVRRHAGELDDQPIDEFLRGAGLIIRSRLHVNNPLAEVELATASPKRGWMLPAPPRGAPRRAGFARWSRGSGGA